MKPDKIGDALSHYSDIKITYKKRTNSILVRAHVINKNNFSTRFLGALE